MGTSRSSGELAAKLVKAGNAIGDANRDATNAAAFIYKRSVLEEAEKDTGGDRILSRAGASLGDGQRKGIKLNAVYTVRGRQNATALLRARPPGPWSWLERGTKAGTRTAKRGRRFRVPGNGRRDSLVRSVNHPGTPAKKTWSRGIAKAEAGAMRTFRAAHKRGLLKSFGAG